ncbi:MAG: nitrite/sulfite reductase [Dehalococcoidia bacterium]
MPESETIVYTNEPGKVLGILQRELEDFDTEASRYLGGEWATEAQWIGFRLKQGVYGQRQPAVQMIRCKLPFGGVTPEQMDAFGEVAEKVAPLRKGHITTRQNIQYHHIPLRKSVEALRILGKAGVSTREACGNTVRNVTGDPYAGVNADEPFDPTPYAAAFARFWLRNPLTQLLPRKMKVAFSASDKDVAIVGLHDLGFIAKVRDGVKGFEIRVAGGLSIMPREAPVLREFEPMDQYLRVSEAVLRIFNRADELRKNRAKARIKFLIERIGIEEFRRWVDKELADNEGGWADKDFSPDRLLFIDDESKTAPAKRDSYAQPSDGEKAAFARWVSTNAAAQRQQGFSTVDVKVTRGDLSPEQFYGLATIMREYCGGRARTSVQQNLVLRWVRDESLYEVWKRLGDLDLNDAGANTITDVVSCPGTDSCKLGITSSMGLNRAIQDKMEALNVVDPLTSKIHIKMSGCPNSCGQHHIANIGFHGAAMKVGDQQLPAYHMFVGGSYTHEEGGFRLATQLKVRMPAKRAPDAAARVVTLYEAERNQGEAFNAFVDRVGTKRLEEAIADLCLPGDFTDDNRGMFMDWGKLDLYQLQRGEGECAV